MTDTNRYRNVSLKHDTYSKIQRLSRQLIPQVNLSVAKTIEVIINKAYGLLKDKTIISTITIYYVNNDSDPLELEYGGNEDYDRECFKEDVKIINNFIKKRSS